MLHGPGNKISAYLNFSRLFVLHLPDSLNTAYTEQAGTELPVSGYFKRSLNA